MKKDKHEEETTNNEEIVENTQAEEQAVSSSEPVNEVQKLEAEVAEAKDKYLSLIHI